MLSIVALGVLLFSVSQASPAREKRWINKYDHPFKYQCPNSQSIWIMRSNHHNGAEDRVWDFKCRHNAKISSMCMWTGYVNDYDATFNFQCPKGAVVTGMGGRHSNGAEDRQYQFRCCFMTNSNPRSCGNTGWLNNFDENVFFLANPDQYIVGVESYHHNGAEDRRFKLHTCHF